MTEYIINGPSSRERLEGSGMEVVTRCRDCDNFKPANHPNVTGEICWWFSEFTDDNGNEILIAPYFSHPDSFCSWAKPRK